MKNYQLGCCEPPVARLGNAPSWYDNIVNETASIADNMWSDVEGAGVWIENEAQSVWGTMTNTPFNPIAAGQNAADALDTGIGNIGRSIGNTFETGFQDVLLVGGGIIVILLLMGRK